MAELVHFYHLYCDAVGYWRNILREHLDACRASGLLEAANFQLGIVGDSESCRDARSVLSQSVVGHAIAVEADHGWEQTTLTVLREYAVAHPDALVCYAHSKGAANPQGGFADAWRRSMTHAVIGQWRVAVALLQAGWDAVGAHWLTPAAYPEQVHNPFFGGNFWWADGGYLAGLPPVGMEKRHSAEQWIGSGCPQVADLSPGWPGVDTFVGNSG